MRVEKVQNLIVGSGVAGVALAQKLLDANAQADILILEAGPKFKMKDFTQWQNYVVTGRVNYTYGEDFDYPSKTKPGENRSVGNTLVPMQGGRLLAYGGSTVEWGGWSFRLKPEDFRLYSNTGHSIDWPIDYDTLEPYYCQAEHYIGVSGDSKDDTPPRSGPYPFPKFPYTLEDSLPADAMESLGITHSHMPIARHGITDTDSPNAPCKTTGTCKYCPFGARFVAGNFLDNMRFLANFPNLKVRDRSIVETVLMDGKHRARGVVVRDVCNKETYIVECERLILAAGTIETAKLLQRSVSEEHPRGVGNEHDLVGRNFITHPYYSFEATIGSNPKRLQPEMGFPTLVSRYYDSREQQKKGKFLIVHVNDSPALNLASGMQNGLTRPEMDALVTGPAQVQLQGQIEVFSFLKNKVSNLNKINHLGMIETKIDYSEQPDFKERLQEVGAYCGQIFKAMGATDITNNMLSWRIDHAACTVRMAETPELGVLDKNLKVWGIDNLYICSNGSFSSLGSVNPTLTLTALALRLGDHLVGQHGSAASSQEETNA